jgi:uncharacterized cysteine cluster protein YcgN (CxxCxxCC family)
MPDTKPFWDAKTLEELTAAEWEALCDGCGRCCLHKLRDPDDGDLAYTAVACRLLDLELCRCTDYARRHARVPDCVRLTPGEVRAADWLPPTCAYRLRAEGKPLAWWHPLVSGDPESVHRGGISVRGRAVSERVAGPLEDHVASWPRRWPKGARGAKPPASEGRTRA